MGAQHWLGEKRALLGARSQGLLTPNSEKATSLQFESDLLGLPESLSVSGRRESTFHVSCVLSRVRLFATLWTKARQASPGKNTGMGCHAPFVFLTQALLGKKTRKWVGETVVLYFLA